MSNPTFSLWRCCLTGETKNPKLKKGKKNGSKENGEANHNKDNAEKKKEDMDLEYQNSVDEPYTSSTPAPKSYDETESGFQDSTAADDSSVSPDMDSSAAPMTVQIVEDSHNSKPKLTEIGSGGRMHLSCKLDKKSNKIHIKINKIEFGPYQEWKMQDLEVSCMLLPMHQQSFRRRSKRFNDPIAIQLPSKAKLSSSSLRFRIYDHKAITRKYLIGQGHVGITSLSLTDGSEVNVILDLNSPDTYGIDTRYITDVRSVGDAVEESGRPEMLISLEYRALTRKLIVEVIKTRGLGLLSGKKPQDVGVEIKLLGKDKQLLRNCRTSVKKHVIDTEFNEMFMFRLNVERLKEVTLQLGVLRYTDIRNKKEVIGECSFGLGSSGIEQQEHWDTLTTADAKAEYRWHPLYK